MRRLENTVRRVGRADDDEVGAVQVQADQSSVQPTGVQVPDVQALGHRQPGAVVVLVGHSHEDEEEAVGVGSQLVLRQMVAIG